MNKRYLQIFKVILNIFYLEYIQDILKSFEDIFNSFQGIFKSFDY